MLRQVRELLADELGLEPRRRAARPADSRAPPGPRARVGAPDAGRGSAARRRTGAPPTAHPATEQVAPWPMVGRDDRPGRAGGAGRAGRARQPVVRRADRRPGHRQEPAGAPSWSPRPGAAGMRVLVGRCSQDDGAPPLYPWKRVLDGLGHEPARRGPERPSGDDGAQFRAWERIARQSGTPPASEPLLVVLDDLHWADTSTLRVLRLLVETVDRARLLVVATWRLQPEPTGALADVAESWPGCTPCGSSSPGCRADRGRRRSFESVTRRELDRGGGRRPAHAHRRQPVLPRRVRAARGGAGRPARRAEDKLPTAVTDVLNRRLRRLPDETVDHAPGRRGARAGLRHPDAGDGHRASTRTTCSTSSTRRRRRGWSARTASTGSGSRTRWSATPCTPA